MAQSREAVGELMKLAVEELIDPLPTKDPLENTQDFWTIFGEFGEMFLTGRFNMVHNNDTGAIVITYKP
jgi:hypothetical protein